MSLDIFTLRVVAGAVVLITSVLYLVQAWERRRELVDRLWMLALGAAFLTSVVLAVDATAPAGAWWVAAVGNATTVLVPFAIWSGIRAGAGKRPLRGVLLAVPAATALAYLRHGPTATEWDGGEVYLAGVAIGCLLGSWEVLHGPLRRYRSGIGLGVVAVLCGGYFMLRFLLLIAVGPDDLLFEQVGGTAPATLMLVVFVNGAAIFMAALRGDVGTSGRPGVVRFDPLTGALPAPAFTERAGTVLGDAAQRGGVVSLVLVELDDVEDVRTAFGDSRAEEVVATAADALQAVTVPGTLIGLGTEDGPAHFQVLLRDIGTEEALGWVGQLRDRLLDIPVVDGTVLLTASVGVSTTDEGGYDLTGLRARALAALSSPGADGGWDQEGTASRTTPAPVQETNR